MEETLKDIKRAISSLLVTTGKGLPLQTIDSEYYAIEYEHIPFREFQCNSLIEFLRKYLCDTLYIQNVGAESICFPIINQDLQRINNLVKKTKKTVKNKIKPISSGMSGSHRKATAIRYRNPYRSYIPPSHNNHSSFTNHYNYQKPPNSGGVSYRGSSTANKNMNIRPLMNLKHYNNNFNQTNMQSNSIEIDQKFKNININCNKSDISVNKNDQNGFKKGIQRPYQTYIPPNMRNQEINKNSDGSCNNLTEKESKKRVASEINVTKSKVIFNVDKKTNVIEPLVYSELSSKQYEHSKMLHLNAGAGDIGPQKINEKSDNNKPLFNGAKKWEDSMLDMTKSKINVDKKTQVKPIISLEKPFQPSNVMIQQNFNFTDINFEGFSFSGFGSNSLEKSSKILDARNIINEKKKSKNLLKINLINDHKESEQQSHKCLESKPSNSSIKFESKYSNLDLQSNESNKLNQDSTSIAIPILQKSNLSLESQQIDKGTLQHSGLDLNQSINSKQIDHKMLQQSELYQESQQSNNLYAKMYLTDKGLDKLSDNSFSSSFSRSISLQTPLIPSSPEFDIEFLLTKKKINVEKNLPLGDLSSTSYIPNVNSHYSISHASSLSELISNDGEESYSSDLKPLNTRGRGTSINNSVQINKVIDKNLHSKVNYFSLESKVNSALKEIDTGSFAQESISPTVIESKYILKVCNDHGRINPNDEIMVLEMTNNLNCKIIPTRCKECVQSIFNYMNYTINAKDYNTIDQVSKEHMYAVDFQSKWFRCIPINYDVSQKKDRITIYRIDVGVVENVSRYKLRELPQNLMKIPISVIDILVYGSNIDDEELTHFGELSLHKRFLCYPHNDSYILVDLNFFRTLFFLSKD